MEEDEDDEEEEEESSSIQQNDDRKHSPESGQNGMDEEQRDQIDESSEYIEVSHDANNLLRNKHRYSSKELFVKKSVKQQVIEKEEEVQ